MDIETVKGVVLLCRNADVTLFMWGRHGIGKSSLVAQLASALEIGMIDLRCSQMEASDLKGLPDKEMEVYRSALAKA